MRNCDFCGTPLPGRRGHGFPTRRGVSCGRSMTLRGKPEGKGLVKAKLPCATAVGS